jgi:glyoxylase-like metal-dependent hydrolase (beta-lactamase superfamily II)
VKALEAVGHTPGHTVYQFGEGAHAFWAVGDIVHFGTVQFQHPDITVGFDWDTTKAAAARLALWQSAAKEGAVLGAAHLAFPGLGHVTVQGKAFAWIPLP